MKKQNTLALIALATGGMLFATTSAHAAEKAADKTQKEKSACSGPNGCDGRDGTCHNASACKGQGACKTDKSSCKGQNSCKGQGWVKVKSVEECKELQAKNAPASEAAPAKKKK
ncbi:MAG: hypothetical protein ABIR96_06540 [Bdellovibrionota bacterium]